MLLSGFMFPFEGMPKWARVIGEALPLTHLVRATRCVFFRGQCGSLVLCEMMPVAVFALIASAIALLPIAAVSIEGDQQSNLDGLRPASIPRPGLIVRP